MNGADGSRCQSRCRSRSSARQHAGPHFAVEDAARAKFPAGLPRNCRALAKRSQPTRRRLGRPVDPGVDADNPRAAPPGSLQRPSGGRTTQGPMMLCLPASARSPMLNTLWIQRPDRVKIGSLGLSLCGLRESMSPAPGLGVGVPAPEYSAAAACHPWTSCRHFSVTRPS